MKYLFKIFAWQPLSTEVVVQADTEQEAIEKVKNLKSEDLEWRESSFKERESYL